MLQQVAICNEVLVEFCKIQNFFKTKGSVKINSNVFNLNDLVSLISNSKDIFIYNSNIFPKRVNIENYNLLEKQLTVKFVNYDTIESVKPYINSALMIKENIFNKFLEATNHPLFYLNYKVVDQNLCELGYVTNIVFNIQNRLVLNTDIEIPLVDTFIIEVDNNNKIIKLKLPEGF